MDRHLLEELQELVTGLCERALSPAQKARLDELVRTNEECCEYYVKVMHVEAALPRYIGTAVRSAAAIVAEWQAREGSTHDAVLRAWAQCNIDDAAQHGFSPQEPATSPSRTPAVALPLASFEPSIDLPIEAFERRRTLTLLKSFLIRGAGYMPRVAAVFVLAGTLLTGILLGALAMAAVPQWNDQARRNSEVTLLGSTGAGFTTALFHSAKQGSVNPNSDSPALPTTTPQDYVHTVSNDTLALFGPTPNRAIWQLRFTGGLLDSVPGNRRVVLGLRTGATPASNLFLPGSGDPAQAGLWVFLTNGVNITPYTIKLAKHGNLVFVNAAGEAQLLATWDWAQFDMSSHPNITVNLDTSETHYALSFDQELINVTGALSGELPSAAPASVRIGVFDQIGEGDVPGSVIVDRIAIANLPAKDFHKFRGKGISSASNKASE